MDVKEFVKETLRQIVEGVKEIQSEVAGKSQVAPIGDKREKVEFDIAVTVEDEKSSGKGAGLSVFHFRAGIDGQASASTSIVHRIKFSVSVDFESKEEQAARKAQRSRHARSE